MTVISDVRTSYPLELFYFIFRNGNIIFCRRRIEKYDWAKNCSILKFAQLSIKIRSIEQQKLLTNLWAIFSLNWAIYYEKLLFLQKNRCFYKNFAVFTKNSLFLQKIAIFTEIELQVHIWNFYILLRTDVFFCYFFAEIV